MSALRPFGGGPFLAADASTDLPPSTFIQYATQRGIRYAVILELTGFPRNFELGEALTNPYLHGPYLAGFGTNEAELVFDNQSTTVWLSDLEYQTEPSDRLRPNLWTEARLESRSDIEETSSSRVGASASASQSIGEFEARDDDRYLKAVKEGYSFEGRPARVWLAEIGRPWSDAHLLASTRVRSITRRNGKARISFDNSILELSSPLSRRQYSGAGGREGLPDNAGDYAPVAYGVCRYAKPYLEDSSRFIFRLNEGTIANVTRVEEAGAIAYTSAGDVATYAELQSLTSTLAEGSYATCLADGSIAIKPAGGSFQYPDAVRVSFSGAMRNGALVETIGLVLEDALLQSGIPRSEIDTALFAAMRQLRVSYYFGGGAASPTIADLFNRLLNAAYGTYGRLRNDKIGARLLETGITARLTGSFAEEEIFSVEEIEREQARIKSQRLGYGPLATGYSQGEIPDGFLTQAELEERTLPYLGYASRTAGDIAFSDASAVDVSDLESSFTDVQSASGALLGFAIFQNISTEYYEVEMSMVAGDVRRGDILNLVHPDFGSASGGFFYVLRKRVRLSRKTVTLTVVG